MPMLPAMSFRRLALAALAGLLLTVLPGCPDPNAPRQLQGSGMDMFAPATMRIHPLTRLLASQPPVASATNPSTTSPADAPRQEQLEVRVEFTDQMGDVTKGVGILRLELFRYATLAPSHHGQRLGLWEVDLRQPDANKAHWDAITRTYFVRRTPDDPHAVVPGQKYVVTATMLFPNASDRQDSMVLTAK